MKFDEVCKLNTLLAMDVAEGTASKIVKLDNFKVVEYWKRRFNEPLDVVERLQGRMLVASYKQEDNGRIGSIHVLDKDEIVCSVVHGSAVLDAKSIVVEKVDRIAVADSNGHLSIYQLHDSQLSKQTSICVELDELILSCEWSIPHINLPEVSVSEGKIATSSSGGKINIHDISNQLKLLCSWKAHDLECWCVSWDWHSDGNVLYSGADDCIIKRWDLRAVDQGLPTWTNSRAHSGGVTSVQVSPYTPHVLLTGSYDEHLLSWDTRMLKGPTHSHHLEGGGVWKVRWHPTRLDLLAVAGMHSGFRVLRWNESSGFSTLASNYSHDSIAYGIDWTQDDTIVSCSFYDCMASEWTILK